MNLPTYVLRSALRNPRRTFLTMLSIGVSLALIVILDTFLLEITKPSNLNEAVPRLVVRHRTSLTQLLPRPYFDKVRKLDGVVAATPMNWFGGIWKDDKFENFFARFAVDPDNFFKVFVDYKPLRPEYLDALKSERTACIIGDKLAERHGFKLGDKIAIQGDIYPFDVEFTVRGFFTGFNADWLLFNLSYLDELEGNAARIGTVFTLAASPERVPEVIKRIEDTFRNSEAPIKVETEKAFQLSFVEMLGNVQLLIRGLVGVVVFAILLIAASTMAMAVRERTREIATLKTLGYSRETILWVVVAEGLTVSILGGLLGVGGAWLLLPNPKLFVSVMSGVLVGGGLGLLMLLASVLLPEPTPNDPASRWTSRLQQKLVVWGPKISFVATGAVTALLIALVPPIDWFKFSGGIIPFLNVRPETVAMGAAITLAVGVFSSVVPAWAASRMGVLDGLRTLG